MMAENTAVKEESGVAKIKAEYIILDYKPTLDTHYVSEEVKEQLVETDKGVDNTSEPPSKRIKLKGRNKQRPKGKRQDASERLCPAYKEDRECKFGDKCKFSHDKQGFFSSKPEDIGPACYLFNTYGFCRYGITCRFAKAHVTEDLQNVKKPNIEDLPTQESTVSNVLTKDLQVSLWKRCYDFSRSDKVLETICPKSNTQKKFDTRKSKDNTVDSVSIAPNPSAGSSDSLADKNTDNNRTTVDNNSSKGTSEDAANSDCSYVKAEVSSEVKPDSDDRDGAQIDAPAGEVDKGAEPNGIQNPGQSTDDCPIRLRPQEKKKIHFEDKLYLAPLTTVGNLPFRRICKRLGADITCGEMAVCTNLLQGQQSEWALMKRHESEDLYGVQLCGAYPDSMTRCAQLITENMNVDFIDINCGCPIDLIFNKGEGSALMGRLTKFEQIVKGMTSVMDIPLTVKVRTGIYTDKNIAHTLLPRLRDWDVALATVHGRSRVQRYTKTADWDYIDKCAKLSAPMPVFGNGDILSYEEANARREQTGVSGLMIARGALIKPWVFTEIKEQRHWDISSGERFDLLRDFTNFGLDHWGSDHQGVENTRKFLLEWLSFLHRYIPVGLLERVPQHVNEKPPYYRGRDDLETLMASPNCGDWIKISEMLLGPVPENFSFLPKHKANAYK